MEDEMATLDYMDFWMRSVYAHTSQNSSSDVDNTRLSPPVFIVGTHRNSLSPDPVQQDQMVRRYWLVKVTFIVVIKILKKQENFIYTWFSVLLCIINLLTFWFIYSQNKKFT